MRVVSLCLDRGVPLLGPKGCSVHLRSVAAALLRGGHAVTAVVAVEGAPGGAEGGMAGGGAWAGGGARGRLLPRGLDVRVVGERPDECALRDELRRHSPDLVLERLALGPATGAEAASACGVRHIYEVNAPLDEEAAAHRGLEDAGAAREELRRGFGLSGGAVAVSDEVAAWVSTLAREGFPIRVVPNGVDPAFFERPDPAADMRARAALGRGVIFRVAFAGSFRPWHDLAGLVRAVSGIARAARPTLVLLGDGPTRPAVIEEARRREVAVVAPGSVSHDEIPAWFRRCDAAVVPYADPAAYFSPLKLAEAMACGLPVIASATGPISRVVTDGVDGLLVAPGNAEALRGAIERLHADPGLRRRLGDAARRTAAERHTWDRVVARVLDFAATAATGARP